MFCISKEIVKHSAQSATEAWTNPTLSDIVKCKLQKVNCELFQIYDNERHGCINMNVQCDIPPSFIVDFGQFIKFIKKFRQQKVENHLKCCAQWRLSGQMYFAASDHHYCVNVGTVIRNQCANRYDQCYRYPGKGKVGPVCIPALTDGWLPPTNAQVHTDKYR